MLLDQAYAELADEDLTARALALPNVVIVRSLSKAYGLAGLRMGYALGPPEAIRWMRAAAGPYIGEAVDAHRARAARDAGRRREGVHRAGAVRAGGAVPPARGAGALAVPSQANFVFARLSGSGGAARRDGAPGIGIRAFPGKPHLRDAVRILVPGNERDFAHVRRAARSGEGISR
ncbi:MAG: aminotransferase class I/II-fold pyridoxal phosphate-dependent enzyme [Polyangiaceae bacterium]